MFVKITASGNRRYVKLVESYRDDAGRVKKRTVATLGRLVVVEVEQFGLGIAPAHAAHARLVAEVRPGDTAIRPTVRHRYFVDGSTEERRLPVELWSQSDQVQVGLESTAKVTEIRLDPDQALPDIDRKNNVLTAAATEK